MATASKQKRAKPERARDLARIHVLAKQLGLQRDQYEAVLLTHAGTDSAAGLDAFQRGVVIAHLERQVKLTFKGRPHNADAEARQVMTKIEAFLADSGSSWAYALAIARRMYRKDRLEFCSSRELAGLLAALERAAVKRQVPELENLIQQSGWCWDYARYAAAELFGHGYERDLRKNAQGLSQMVRWLKGGLAPWCAMRDEGSK